MKELFHTVLGLEWQSEDQILSPKLLPCSLTSVSEREKLVGRSSANPKHRQETTVTISLCAN